VESIISVQEEIDWDYVYEQLKPLAKIKGEPEILLDLEKIRSRLNK
jgi:hypothetical protein